MKKNIIIVILVLCIVGVGGYIVYDKIINNSEVEITMNCKGTTTQITAKENHKLICELLGEEYEFTVDTISNDSITISTNKDGISSGPGILDSEKKWIIKKGEKVIIHTNSTDWQDTVEFSW